MRSYQYGGMSYANPHALTTLSNGLSTTTYAYDAAGNVTQKTTDGIVTTYLWDYANRLTALGVAGATTTYGYSAFGERVLQIGTSTTWIYPFKWYSVASSTAAGARYSTTTEYVFSGDTLVSTIDQQLAGGVATGSPQTRFIHPDHLGSTNVVTNASGTVVQTLDYYPYGGTRISTNVGGADSARKYIGQFTDQSNLLYLNARHYDPGRGQFISQDPSFLAVGYPKQLKQITGLDQQTFLADPQLANSTSYARNNPITLKDPDGKFLVAALPWIYLAYSGSQMAVDSYDWYNMNVRYADYTTQTEKDLATSQLVFDGVTFATGQGLQLAGYRAASIGLDTMFATRDAVGTRADNPLFNHLQQNYLASVASNRNRGLPMMNVGGSNYGAALSNVFSVSVQARRDAAISYNSSTGASGSGGSAPSNDSLWVTPSGAVVTFGGQLVAAPPQTSSTSNN
jgi:RHS repeat-associated protein